MYIDREYIENRLSDDTLLQLSNVGDGVRELNGHSLSAAIADSEQHVNLYLKKAGYVVPVAAPTAELQTIVFDVFIYKLYSRKYDTAEKVPGAIASAMEDTKSLLNKLATGELTLDLPRVASPASCGLSVAKKHRMFPVRGGFC